MLNTFPQIYFALQNSKAYTNLELKVIYASNLMRNTVILFLKRSCLFELSLKVKLEVNKIVKLEVRILYAFPLKLYGCFLKNLLVKLKLHSLH